jgi:hypothetical protein
MSDVRPNQRFERPVTDEVARCTCRDYFARTARTLHFTRPLKRDIRPHGMRHRAPVALFTLLAGSPGAFAQTNIPPFVAKLITHYKSVPPKTSPDSIWRYTYKGESVYYVPPLWCCDIPSLLYDAKGNLLCRPDGGFVGIGDGKCPDFLKERSHGELLWSDGTAKESP